MKFKFDFSELTITDKLAIDESIARIMCGGQYDVDIPKAINRLLDVAAKYKRGGVNIMDLPAQQMEALLLALSDDYANFCEQLNRGGLSDIWNQWDDES